MYVHILREANQLRDIIIEGVKKRLDGLGIQWNPHRFQGFSRSF